jgi:hypothetical protein
MTRTLLFWNKSQEAICPTEVNLGESDYSRTHHLRRRAINTKRFCFTLKRKSQGR